MADPFAVDTERAIEALRLEWGEKYEIAAYRGLFAARYKDSGQVISGETPDEITRKIERDWAARNPQVIP